LAEKSDPAIKAGCIRRTTEILPVQVRDNIASVLQAFFEGTYDIRPCAPCIDESAPTGEAARVGLAPEKIAINLRNKPSALCAQKDTLFELLNEELTTLSPSKAFSPSRSLPRVNFR
jgi:hypothetical protein